MTAAAGIIILGYGTLHLGRKLKSKLIEVGGYAGMVGGVLAEFCGIVLLAVRALTPTVPVIFTDFEEPLYSLLSPLILLSGLFMLGLFPILAYGLCKFGRKAINSPNTEVVGVLLAVAILFPLLIGLLSVIMGKSSKTFGVVLLVLSMAVPLICAIFFLKAGKPGREPLKQKHETKVARIWRLFKGIVVSPQKTIDEMVRKNFFNEVAFFILLLAILIFAGSVFYDFIFAAKSAAFTITSWFISAAMIWLISQIIGGRGGYKQTLVCTGAAHIPLIISSTCILFLQLFPNIPIILSILGGVSVFCMIWFFALLIVVVKQTQKFSYTKAVVSTLLIIMGDIVLLLL
jgi:hypothetical protein